MKMKYKPVVISIENYRDYEKVALLVDREDFLRDLKKIRINIGLVKPLSGTFRTTMWRLNKKYLKSPEEQKMFDDVSKKYYHKDVFDSVRLLAKKYREEEPETYAPFIFHALIYNNVPKDMFRNSWYLVINQRDVSESFGYEQKKPYIQISLTPYVTKQDILEVYDRMRPYLKKRLDPITNIKRDRQWYWMHKNGMSYAEILKTTSGISKQGIIEAIKQYKKRLTIQV